MGAALCWAGGGSSWTLDRQEEGHRRGKVGPPETPEQSPGSPPDPSSVLGAAALQPLSSTHLGAAFPPLHPPISPKFYINLTDSPEPGEWEGGELGEPSTACLLSARVLHI